MFDYEDVSGVDGGYSTNGAMPMTNPTYNDDTLTDPHRPRPDIINDNYAYSPDNTTVSQSSDALTVSAFTVDRHAGSLFLCYSNYDSRSLIV